MIYSPHQGGKTLLDVLDNTTSPMGARMLKRWTVMPLLDIQKINERLNAVEYFVNHPVESEELKN